VALEAVKARDEQKYGQAFRVLCTLQQLQEKLLRCRTLMGRLEGRAPRLAANLAIGFSDSVWDGRMAEFSNAWNWRRADLWLVRLNAPNAEETLTQNLHRYRREILQTVGELAAAHAWEHCLNRMTEQQRRSLVAWAQEVRKIGKGTGKWADTHRRVAREYMEQCRAAIPAWVMPLYRVAETVRPGVETFDVVIIDEASQSGPEALLLQYLAKKIVVVGDSKQISPDPVGVDQDSLNSLRQQYISDLPFGDRIGAGDSFFDLAEIYYSGRIRLREHLRCMPEIIQFSNNLCYAGDPLIPLRQFGADRLRPIETRQVAGGYQKGASPRIVNPPEAEAIVAQIKACFADPVYRDKTMGVISLLGEPQAKFIHQLLVKEIGPEEMQKRHLICGDAYAFQGDERDVIFLSLVSAAAEDHHIGVLGSAKDEKRFNVAASRAKDQMWLFHTATLNDLSVKCVRYRLLEYCQNPKVQQTQIAGLDFDELRLMAHASDRRKVAPPNPFESWFEADVFLRIHERGYRVLPQFLVAGYFADLVVEGMRGRLAVECDGDFWHGPERYEEDAKRQRQIERCGWRVWRVRGSSFYREPAAALESLWNLLERLGIRPESAAARATEGSHAEDLSSDEVKRIGI